MLGWTGYLIGGCNTPLENVLNCNWAILLKGETEITFYDNSKVVLKAGDYINIIAHQKHEVSWTAPEIETIWLAVHY